MLKHFNYLRDKGLDLVAQARENADVAALIDQSTLTADVQALQEGTFHIAVIAPFSAGKSTFINGLLGTDLLSMSILAETAIVTRVRYGEEPRLTVHYADGSVESLPGGELRLSADDCRELLRLITTVQRTPQQDQHVREYLKRYNEAPGATAEEKIHEVVLDWPVDLCKDGVELVDTPGLFSRHEKHGYITGRVLPAVHAVVFVLEPTQIGQAGFQAVIQKYVQEAQNSNLAEKAAQSRHIFFLLNKIDRLQNQAEYDSAVTEIRTAMADMIDEPQILGVSSYFALAARRALQGGMPIEELRGDKFIVIDDPDYPGRPLFAPFFAPRHLPHLLAQSRIEAVEAALGEYLEGRHINLVQRVARSLHDVYRSSADQAEKSMQAARQSLTSTRADYSVRIRQAQSAMKAIQSALSNRIEDLIREALTFNKASSLKNEVSESLKKYEGALALAVRKELGSAWAERRGRVKEENARQLLEEVSQAGEQQAQLATKGAVKQAFEEIQSRIVKITRALKEEFEVHRVRYDEVLEQELGLNGDGGFALNTENLAAAMQSEVERLFQEQVRGLADEIQGRVRSASNEAESYVSAPGLWNFFMSLFGADDKVRKFDVAAFRAELDAAIEDFGNHYAQYIATTLNKVVTKIKGSIDAVAKEMEKQAEQVLSFELRRQQSHLEQIRQELESNAGNLEGLIRDKQALKERLAGGAAAAGAFYQECERGR